MTKKITILTGIFICALFFAQDVSTIRNTTEIYDNHSSGTARYSSMAGSMGALGGDISIISTNPAGLGIFITNDVNIGLNFGSSQSTASLAEKSLSNSIDNFNLGQVGSVFSFQAKKNSPWKFINLGINFINERIDNRIQSPANQNIKSNYEQNGIITDHLLYSGHFFERIGNRSKMNFSIGGNYENKIYIGAGINLSSVNVEQYDQVFLTSENSPKERAYFRKQNTPYHEDAGGFSISAGVIGKLNQQFRLGFALESPIWYNVDREYTEHTFGNSAYSTIYFETRSMRTPGKLTLSGAVIPNKNFALNIDYRVDLGKPHFRGGNTENQLNDFYQSTYKAQNEMRLGSEFRHRGLRMRAGYSFTTSPFKNYSYSESNYGIINNDGSGVSNSGKISNYIVGKYQVISGGLGYDFKTFYVDATYRYTTYNYANPFIDGVYVYRHNSIESPASIISNVKNKRESFILTLGWKF